MLVPFFYALVARTGLGFCPRNRNIQVQLLSGAPIYMINVKISKKFTFDEEKERVRLIKCFSGLTLTRQLILLDLFCAGDWENWIKSYNVLPDNESDECSEKEYVCCEIMEFFESYYTVGFDVDIV